MFSSSLEKSTLETDTLKPWSPILIASSPSFSVSDDKRTIKRIQTDNVWQGILAEPCLPMKGRHKFSVKILNTTVNSYMMIGLALSTTNLQTGAFTQNSSWMFYCTNNYIYVAGVNKPYAPQPFKPSTNDIITVVIDMDRLTMGIEVNGFTLGPMCKLNITEVQKMYVCPAVDFYNVNDSIQFL